MSFFHNNRHNDSSHKESNNSENGHRLPTGKSASFLIMVVLLGLLVACSSTPTAGTSGTSTTGSTSSQPTATATSSAPTTTPPTATPTLLPGPTATAKPAPVGTVLYHADASTGFAAWNPSGPWKNFNNILVNDGTGTGSGCGGDIALLPPYQPTTPDLKIVAEIQFPQNYHSNGTGLVARIGTVQNMVIGYSAFVRSDGHIADVNGCNDISSNTYGFQPSQSVHRFEMDIKGTDMKFYIDGGLVVAASDAKYLSPGAVGIFTSQEYIKVSSFTVYQL